MRISNHGPEVFSSYNSRKSRSEIAVWMTWPLNRVLGAELVWPSNHFRLYTASCICTEAQEMRAPCMFDWRVSPCQFTQLIYNFKPYLLSFFSFLVHRNYHIFQTHIVNFSPISPAVLLLCPALFVMFWQKWAWPPIFKRPLRSSRWANFHEIGVIGKEIK